MGYLILGLVVLVVFVFLAFYFASIGDDSPDGGQL